MRSGHGSMISPSVCNVRPITLQSRLLLRSGAVIGSQVGIKPQSGANWMNSLTYGPCLSGRPGC